MKKINYKDTALYKSIRHIGEIVSDILWPKRCIVCNCRTPLGQEAALCRDCMELVKKISTDFVEPDRYFEQAISALPYEGNTKASLIRYKFKDYEYLKHAFSLAMELCLDGTGITDDYHIICPVPIHHLRDRQYNQSLLMAHILSGRLGLEFYPDLLIKTKNLTPLSKMGYAMREVSIKGAIDFNLKYDISNKNILLVDDIYTTGSTVNECSKILRMHGAQKVCALTSCYADVKGGTEDGSADILAF